MEEKVNKSIAALDNDKLKLKKFIKYYFLKKNKFASENLCQNENNKKEQKYITL